MSLFTHPGSILGDRICRGARYLIPLLPFLMLALGTVAHRIPFWLLGITGSVSILINWTGTQYIVPQNAFGALLCFFLGGHLHRCISSCNPILPDIPGGKSKYRLWADG